MIEHVVGIFSLILPFPRNCLVYVFCSNNLAGTRKGYFSCWRSINWRDPAIKTTNYSWHLRKFVIILSRICRYFLLYSEIPSVVFPIFKPMISACGSEYNEPRRSFTILEATILRRCSLLVYVRWHESDARLKDMMLRWWSTSFAPHSNSSAGTWSTSAPWMNIKGVCSTTDLWITNSHRR